MREFRVHHDEFQRAHLGVVSISLSPPAENRLWTRRLELPYPLLSDEKREAALAFGVLRRIGVAGWNLEILTRSTFLADDAGVVRAVWEKAKIRGHARDVLEVAQGLKIR